MALWFTLALQAPVQTNTPPYTTHCKCATNRTDSLFEEAREDLLRSDNGQLLKHVDGFQWSKLAEHALPGGWEDTVDKRVNVRFRELD